MSLEDDYEEGTDTLKVLAACEPTDFGLLILPALDQPEPNRGSRGGSHNALEELLAALNREASATERGLRVMRKAEWEWISAKVLGEEHRDVAVSLNNFGLLYLAMGDYIQAESCKCDH